jgi:hypothetical protein
MKLTYFIFSDSIVVNFKNKTITIPKGDDRHSKVLSLIESNQLDLIPAIADRDDINKIKKLLKLK